MHRARAAVPAAASCALAACATTATAVPEPSAPPEVGLTTPAKKAQLQQQLVEVRPVIATY
ncbi:hypothetical protein OG272_15795 [Streptomyces sp. NBC_00104]|uniref:hypothetical protein n=1 Tax=Streptomyces sp. NBC_00104 TaxID=2903621 RepID=UPI0032524C95